MTKGSFKNNEIHFSEKKLTLNSSKIGPSQLHKALHSYTPTARTVLQLVGAEKAPVVCSTRIL